MSEQIKHIYDLAMKRMLALSGKSVVRMMNSLFQMEYSLDSEIVFGETESVNDKLKSKRSDKILTINGKDCYHVEVQSTPDNTMVLRVFEYGFQHAKNNWRAGQNLKFPASKVIYLCKNTGGSIRKLKLHFQDQGTFSYYVEIFDLLAFSAEELDKKGMVILVPFQILKFRKDFEKERNETNIKKLQTLILHDIISAIDANLLSGMITETDAIILKEITQKLYVHIYGKYEELKEWGLDKMVEDVLLLEADHWLEKLQEKEQEKEAEKQEALSLEADRWLEKLQEKEQEKEAEKQEALSLEADRWLEKLQEKQELILRQEKRNTIALYQELHDMKKTAQILSLPLERVKEYLQDSEEAVDELFS